MRLRVLRLGLGGWRADGWADRGAPPPPPPAGGAASTEAAPPIANHLHPPLYAAAAHGRSSQRRCRARRRAPAAAAAAAARPRLLPAGSSVLRSPRHSGDAAGCRGRDRADAAPRRPRALSPALCSCLRRLQRSSAASGSWRRCRGAPPSLLPKSNNSNGSCLKLCPPAFFQPSAGCQQGRHDAAGQRRSEGAPECRGAAVRPRRCGGRPAGGRRHAPVPGSRLVNACRVKKGWGGRGSICRLALSTPLSASLLCVCLAESGHSRCVDALLRRKADPDAADSEGATPLLAALAGGHRRAAEVLLAAGAHAGAGRIGELLCGWAEELQGNGIMPSVHLRRTSVRVSAGGRSALHWAAHHGLGTVLHKLLSAPGGGSVDVDAVDEAGYGTTMLLPAQYDTTWCPPPFLSPPLIPDCLTSRPPPCTTPQRDAPAAGGPPRAPSVCGCPAAAGR